MKAENLEGRVMQKIVASKRRNVFLRSDFAALGGIRSGGPRPAPVGAPRKADKNRAGPLRQGGSVAFRRLACAR